MIIFSTTDLHQKLQQHSVKQLVICGMMSHMCVDSTTRCANELGYQPILIHDACTTRDLEFNDEIIPAKKSIIALCQHWQDLQTLSIVMSSYKKID